MGQSASAGTSQPPAARRGYDRSADERTDPGLLEQVLGDPATRVVLVDGDRVPVDASGTLLTVSVDEAALGDIAFLGRLDDTPLVVAPVTAADVPRVTTWASLRDVVPLSSADVADLIVVAVSAGRWIVSAAFCPACGSATDLTTAGWARRCRGCDREHFPRTDPAVIVAVSSGDRLLLGSNALWEANRFSCFAGFVEAGESLESAVRREVREESGIDVIDVRYFGSQPWPFPRSLMLGFHAEAADAATAEADGEEILEVRWFTRAEIREALAGESSVRLPGEASIAHALISAWARAE